MVVVLLLCCGWLEGVVGWRFVVFGGYMVTLSFIGLFMVCFFLLLCLWLCFCLNFAYAYVILLVEFYGVWFLLLLCLCFMSLCGMPFRQSLCAVFKILVCFGLVVAFRL